MTRIKETTETLIIGGGLAGLSLAHSLAQQNSPFVLVEARTRFGGRILTNTHGGGQFDMGPAWFWPGQPRIAQLVSALGLRWFEQFSTGAAVFEDANGRVQRGGGQAAMAGSLRIDGGMGALVSGLASSIPESDLCLGTPIVGLRQASDGVIATTSDGTDIAAQRVVLTMPPRLAAGLGFDPALPPQTIETLQNVPTWMAGQAKALAVYDTPFWRDGGLSGDAFSRHGPMVEIHDASAANGGPFALFGFIGVPVEGRGDEGALRQAVIQQLARLFGPQAETPPALWIKDWAFDEWTASSLDHQPLYAHPRYGLPPAMRGLWDNRLLFGGTEVAPQFGGYLEGALEAAENALHALESHEGIARKTRV